MAHGESTVQAHDSKKVSWIREGEQPIRKKKLAGAFIKVTLFAPLMGGWLMQVRHLNMAKIMMASGIEHYFSNRLDLFHFLKPI